jgi:hypothetical protein
VDIKGILTSELGPGEVRRGLSLTFQSSGSCWSTDACNVVLYTQTQQAGLYSEGAYQSNDRGRDSFLNA